MNTLEFKNYVTKLKLEYNECIISIAHDIYNDNICNNDGHYNDDEGDISIFERYEYEIWKDESIVDLILLCSCLTDELEGKNPETEESFFSNMCTFKKVKQEVSMKAFFFEVGEEIENIIDKNRKY